MLKMKADIYSTPIEKKPKLLPKPQICIDQSKKDPVSVFCRIKPLDDPLEGTFAYPINSRSIKLCPPVSSFAFRNGSAKEQIFKFKHVFPEDATQKEVFDQVAKPLILNLVNGKNGLLFVYGITGSGKTYTMEGTKHDGGIVRRTIDIIFNSIGEYQTMKYVFKPDRMNGFEAHSEAEAMLDRQRLDILPGLSKRTRKKKETSIQNSSDRVPDTSKILGIDEDNAYSIFINYVEIYNNFIYDLLESTESSITKNLQSKILREDAKHNMYIHGCTEVEVKTPEEAIEVLIKGQKKRKVAHTKLNCESSRSHSVFTVRVVQAPHDAQGESVITEKSAMVVSQLSMVDLAGSERNSRTKATGDRIKEAGNINNSLMALRQCIETLRENQMFNSSKKVPYRESKLTHYFKNYFDGEGTINMVVCVNPRIDDYDETLPVMKFAEIASEVQVHRPVSAFRPDFGFTPGRRRANKVFKEARRRIYDEGFKPKELEAVDITPIYSLGPAWPPVNFNSDEGFEEIVNKLKSVLEMRMANKQKFVSNLRDDELTLREKITNVEKENLVLRQENGSLRSLYDDAMLKVKHYETLLLNAEATNTSLHRKFTDYNALMDDYRQACEERDLAKSQGQIEKQRMKSSLKAKLEFEREKMAKDMNDKLKEQTSQLKTQLYATQVRALQGMFEGNPPPPIILSQPTPVKFTKSDPKLNEAAPKAEEMTQATPKSRRQRSLSQGANVGSVWIDHRPDQVVDPGTVLQPNLPRRRSVQRLNSGDFLESKKASHYCLTTVDKDSSGEIQTKMYKGDVLPTVGGGSQVVFQDVEILKQRDPLDVPSVKRGSDGTPKVIPQVLQNRCAQGIGSNIAKSSYASSAKRFRN